MSANYQSVGDPTFRCWHFAADFLASVRFYRLSYDDDGDHHDRGDCESAFAHCCHHQLVHPGLASAAADFDSDFDPDSDSTSDRRLLAAASYY